MYRNMGMKIKTYVLLCIIAQKEYPVNAAQIYNFMEANLWMSKCSKPNAAFYIIDNPINIRAFMPPTFR